MTARSQREMLEAALAADFDDLAAHAAYADLLAEEGDPRGEYIQLRLALEDQNQPHRRLQEYRERATRLYQKHEREWLGPLGPFLLGRPRATVEPIAPNIDFTFRRGWLAELHVQVVRDAFTTVLAGAPQARLLQALTLRDTRSPNSHGPLEPLVDSPYLRTVQSFALGEADGLTYTADGRLASTIVRKMQAIQNLELRARGLDTGELLAHPMPRLRSLVLDYLQELPLRSLADNPALASVERLFLWARDGAIPEPVDGGGLRLVYPAPGPISQTDLGAFLKATHDSHLTDLTLRAANLGDGGCAEIARSGILRRLRRLDLRYCGITDAGAEILARSPDLGHLDWLDVGANQLTPTGVDRLLETEIRVQWDSQGGEDMRPEHFDEIAL